MVVNHFCTSHIERCWNPERNDPGFQFPMSIWFILQVCRRRHVLLYQAQERAVDNSVHSDVFLKATVLKFIYETKLQWMSIYSFNIARQITTDTCMRRHVRCQIVENGSLRLARPPWRDLSNPTKPPLQIRDEQKQCRHTVRTLWLDALELFISAKKGFVVIAWLGLAGKIFRLRLGACCRLKSLLSRAWILPHLCHVLEHRCSASCKIF